MRNLKRRFERFTAIALAVLMVVTTVDLSTFAVSAAGEGSGTYCEHHAEHTPECGYTEGIEGSPCTHEHGEECYSEVTVCVHGHDESCGYVEGVEDSCTHICSLENGCIISALNCIHEHDEKCGYQAAVEGTPCIFECEECATVCTCETDDPTYHAPFCDLYELPENPQCFCVEKCTEDSVNEWCDVCYGVGVEGCEGEAPLLSENVMATYASASTPVLEGRRVYANGTPITIEAGSSSSTASVWYMNGSTKTYVAENVSDAVIYGGCDGESLDSDTNITMTGGSVYAIYGGGYNTDCSKGYVNNVNIIISGGTVSYGVYASNSNRVKGNVNITVTGGNISTVYGCTLTSQANAGDNQEYCRVDGSASVTITGGTVGTLKIGDGYSPVNGTRTGIVTIPGVRLETNSGFNAENEYNNLYVNDGTTFVVKGDVTLPENTKLIIPSGKTLSLNSYTKVEAPYGIENNGTLNIESGCTDTYNIENNGTLNISTPYENSEGIVNDGTINLTKPILGDKPTGNGTINRNTAYISGISSVSSISVKMDDADYALANGYYETADGKLYLWLRSGYAVVFVDGSVYCGMATEGTAVELLAYKAVSDIETVSSRIPVGINYDLSTYAVTNNDATYKTIEWSVVNANATGATITDNAIKATSEGTATIRATVNNGQAYGTAYTKEYLVTFYVTDGIDISLGSITISKKDDTTITVAGTGIPNGSKDYPVNESIRIIGSTTSNTITISEGTTANLILADVKIDVSGTEGATPLYVNSNAQLNLTLEGTNELKGGFNAAALGVPSGAELVIEESSMGTLEATGGHDAAGIGGGRNGGIGISSGTITINGGTITAICNSGWAAGIGGGNGGSGGTTTINGGTITASSSKKYGAGIGGGTYGSGGTVIINGGTVTAEGYYGIGSGSSAGGGTLKITGGNISGTYNIAPTDGSNEVSCYTCKFIGDSEDMAEKTVTAITLENGGTYGLKDVVTFDGGSENEGYFNCYLPAGSKIASITVGGTTYICRGEDGTCHVDHDWVDATCQKPEHCSACELTSGDVIEHDYVDGFCTMCHGYNSDVFVIDSPEDLVAFAENVNAGNKSLSAVLEADIDMENVDWTPVCQTVSYHETAATDTGYTGTFDGKGHTISNLTVTGISGGTYSYGLFGTVSGTVRNLGMVNYTYTMGSATDARAGSVAGQVLTGGTITNCYSVGHTVTTSNNIAGGIAGCTYGGTISNCYALNGSVSGHDTRWGGVVGDCQKDDNTYGGTVSNCYTDDTRVVSTQNSSAIIEKCEVMDDTAFASGEITYLLNGSSSENVTWYQTLETDTYPVLNSEHGKVYSGYTTELPCEVSYTNDKNSLLDQRGEHAWDTGVCTKCDAVCTHSFDANGECSICGFVLVTELSVRLTNGGAFAEGEYTFADNIHTINTDKSVTISGTTTSERIFISNGCDANIILAGIDINVSGIYGAYGIGIADNSTGDVTITLKEGTTNKISAGKYRAAVHKPVSNSNVNSGEIGLLTIQGEGSLEAIGNYAAGIGGNEATSNITITGGNIKAVGSYQGAGIGAGDEDGKCSNITITGGTITAIGGNKDRPAGIGTIAGRISNVYISGGSVNAYSMHKDGFSIGHYSGTITPTVSAENSASVYLLEIDNPEGRDITINGKDYPDFHGDEKKIYVYLPAGTAENPNIVKFSGNTVAAYYYDSGWKTVVCADGHTASEDDGDCTTDITCEKCGHVISEGADAHNWENGECTNTNCEVVCTEHTDENPVDSVCDVCGTTLHTHEWTYTASNNTITAECGAADCPLNGAAKTIVISASDKTYDGTAVVATVENNVDTTDYSSSIVYKDNDGDDVDEAVNAGTYTANLTVGGVTAKVEFTIAKGTPDIGTVSASNMENTLDVSQVVLSRSNETVPGTLSLAEGTTLQYGIHDYIYVFTPNDNINYETVTRTVSITITDTNAPTATYKVGTDGWKQFINTITFGHFCKDKTTIDITYSDEGSGVADKQYYISEEEITNAENFQWSEYTDTLKINATGKYYIYVKVTDKGGNEVIRNSEGIVVYAESVITPTSFAFEYGEENDLSVNISTNGNTFANLTDGSGNEIATENYSIVGSTLTIKGEYLSDLDFGEYTYKICMNPQGVENTEVTLAYSFVVNVTAKELTVTGATATSRDYIANDKTVDITGVTLSGIQGTDDVSVEITGL